MAHKLKFITILGVSGFFASRCGYSREVEVKHHHYALVRPPFELAGWVAKVLSGRTRQGYAMVLDQSNNHILPVGLKPI
jgi:hypothetical protein